MIAKVVYLRVLPRPGIWVGPYAPYDRRFILARSGQEHPVMAPFQIPHLIGMNLQYGRRHSRKRVLIAGMVRV